MKIDQTKDLFRLIRRPEKKYPTSVWTLLGYIKRLKQFRLYGCMRPGETRGTSRVSRLRAESFVTGNDHKMKNGISYKNCLIQGESFQREKNGTWVPQYILTRQETGNKGNDFPSQQYQPNETFPTEDEADDFALQRAMEWIDKN
jgi:hypothetical protein